MQHSLDIEARVESDQVGEREGAHGVAHAEAERRVDVLGGGDALHGSQSGEKGKVEENVMKGERKSRGGRRSREHGKVAEHGKVGEEQEGRGERESKGERIK